MNVKVHCHTGAERGAAWLVGGTDGSSSMGGPCWPKGYFSSKAWKSVMRAFGLNDFLTCQNNNLFNHIFTVIHHKPGSAVCHA